MSEQYITNVIFDPTPTELRISYNFRAYFKPEGEMYSCVIPAFGLCFSAKSKDEAVAKAPKVASLYLDFWVQQQGLSKFSIELHKLGFRAKRDAIVMQMFTKNKPIKAQFDSSVKNVDESYKEEAVFSGESSIAA
jgi:hypothetical protein